MTELNMHGDHVASCLCCTRLTVSQDGFYSELTPGEGAYIECGAGVFQTIYAPASDDMHQLQIYGRTCPKFNPRT